MLKERLEIVVRIQGRLHDTEMAVEAALTAIGMLAAALPQARERAGIAPVAGQAAFDSIAAALSGIVQVRAHLVAAHGHLEETRTAFRLPIVDTGAGYIKIRSVAGNMPTCRSGRPCMSRPAISSR